MAVPDVAVTPDIPPTPAAPARPVSRFAIAANDPSPTEQVPISHIPAPPRPLRTVSHGAISLPPLTLLGAARHDTQAISEHELAETGELIEQRLLSLIHISEPTRPSHISRIPSSA